MEQYNRVVNIYVDEYGTPDLDTTKAGNEAYFIYTAVIIEERNLEQANFVYSKIISEDFSQQGYIKSSHIPNDKTGYAKTMNALTILKGLNHHVFALVIDKAHLQGHPGLSVKTVFIKFFQRVLVEHFYDIYDEFHIYADETGRSNFLASLKSYMQNVVGLTQTLFSNNTIEYHNDREMKLIQLADFYAGIVGKYFCGKYEENRAKTIHGTIKTRLSIQWVPNEFIPCIVATNDFDKSFSSELLGLAIKTGTDYLETYKCDISGCELIQYMIQEARCNPMRHISSRELKERLRQKHIEIGDPIVKVSELRDHGVLIISPIGKKGYKFPTSEREIAEFYNRLSSNVIPQLRRGYILNEILKQRSIGKYDILNDPNFSILNALSELVNKG